MSGRRESNPLLRTGGTPSGSEGLCAAITPLPREYKFLILSAIKNRRTQNRRTLKQARASGIEPDLRGWKPQSGPESRCAAFTLHP